MEAFVSIHKLTTMAYDVEKVVRLVLPGKPVIATDDHPDPVLLRRRHDLTHGKSDAIPVNLAPRLYFDTEVSGQAGLGKVHKMCTLGLCQLDLADRRFTVSIGPLVNAELTRSEYEAGHSSMPLVFGK